MKSHESERALEPTPEILENPEGLIIRSEQYSLQFLVNKPYVTLLDNENTPWASLFLPGGVDTLETFDETYSVGEPEVTRDGKETIVRFVVTSTAWNKKEVVWRCRQDSIETYYELEGQGNLTDMKFFEGALANGKFTGELYSSTFFKSVFNPEPTSDEKRAHLASQRSSIDVMGLPFHGRENWFFTPGPYCFGMNQAPPEEGGALPHGKWLMMGLAAPIESQNFTGVQYEGREKAFSLRFAYQGHMSVRGAFRSPSVIMNFIDDPYKGLAEYSAQAEARGYAPPRAIPARKPGWWSRPIFCGWGVQCEMYEGVDKKQLATAHIKISPQFFSRQPTYDNALEALSEFGINFGTIVLDDKWQKEYGTNTVDEHKWPDFEGWIERRHSLGQKVLLWLKAFDIEGLPPELCVATKSGEPVAADPTNPEYEAVLRAQVRHMLSRDGYGADGFKLDFTGRTPSGRNLINHGPEWGASLLHKLLKTIYSEAKRVREDALIINHSPNPWFRDVSDMIRLNDINKLEDVNSSMRHRAQVIKAICPDHLIDTDNWPMLSKRQWRDYVAIQPELGVPAIYYANSVNGEPLTPEDYVVLRQSLASAQSS